MNASAICTVCGVTAAGDEFLIHEGKTICAGCKVEYFQRLREMGAIESAKYPSFWLRVFRLAMHSLWGSVLFGIIRAALGMRKPANLVWIDLLLYLLLYSLPFILVLRAVSAGHPRLRQDWVSAFLFPALMNFLVYAGCTWLIFQTIALAAQRVDFTRLIYGERYEVVGSIILTPLLFSIDLLITLLLLGFVIWIGRTLKRIVLALHRAIT